MKRKRKIKLKKEETKEGKMRKNGGDTWVECKEKIDRTIEIEGLIVERNRILPIEKNRERERGKKMREIGFSRPKLSQYN